MVAKGYDQQLGFDFSKTFNPMVKLVTIRIVITLASINGWKFHQLDINNTFLDFHLNEEVYMAQPQGFEHLEFPHHVCKLQKPSMT